MMTPDNNMIKIDQDSPLQKAWREKLQQSGVDCSEIILNNLEGRGVGVELFTPPPGATIPVGDLLLHPENYRGNGQANVLVYFKELFTGLRGYHPRLEEDWTPEAAQARGIVDLSAHIPHAAKVSRQLTEHALKVVANPNLYKDVAYRRQYGVLANLGYQLLITFERQFGRQKFWRIPGVMLRAGDPATSYTYGQDYRQTTDAFIVDGKRVHLIGEQPGDLAVSLFGLDFDDLQRLNNADLINCDPAHASGGTFIALILALQHAGIRPRSLQARCLAGNRASTDLSLSIFRQLGVVFEPYMLKIGTSLNEHYYLDRRDENDDSPVVADAGDALCGPNSV